MNDEDLQLIFAGYREFWGTRHPERSITLDQFRERVIAFEAVIDPWITGEGSMETSIRAFSKILGMKTSTGRMVFRVLFAAVDAVHPVS